MKHYAAYLFDADGTLLDSTELIYQCFVHTCSMFAGLELTREQVFANIGLPLRKQLGIHLGELSGRKADEVRAEHMRYQLSIYEKHLRLFPGVKEGLKGLKESGRKLGVVTSRLRKTLDIYLRHTGIVDFFEVLITPESTARHKPHPEPALAGARLLGCEPSEALFVGDAGFDMECGAAAGMDTAFVAWSRIDSRTLAIEPTYRIADFRDLL